MESSKGILIAGTDTGVGKTVVSVLLIAALRTGGMRAVGMKPVESGCAPDPLDALSLLVASEEDIPLDDLCPYRFRNPVAPEVAAASEGTAIDLSIIESAFQRLSSRYEKVIIESAGGIGTPYGPDLLVMDLARMLKVPVLLVARDVLGVVGQALTALRAMQHASVQCLGIILCRTTDDPPGPDAATNVSLITSHSEGVPVLGMLPFIPEPLPPPTPPDPLRDWSRRYVALFERASTQIF
jgi:dethiobiotin synthetase